MVEGLIGRKVGMTQTFNDAGNVIPVTVIKAGPCTVIQKKTEEKDGYSVLQLSLVEEKGEKKPSKPLIGHYTKSGIPPAKILREFRFRTQAEVKEGDQFFVDIFQVGERVRVVGTSKGKGFAGVIKRWGFHGGKASHGSMFHRSPGSIGASAYPSRVVKGKKLPGQMGDQRITVKNLTVIEADRDNNLLVLKGTVPGARGGYVLIKKEDFHPEEPEPERAKPAQPQAEKPEPEEKKAEKPAPGEVRPEKEEPEKEHAEKPEQEKVEPKEEKPEPEKDQPEAKESASKKDKDEPSEKPESESAPHEPQKEKKKE
ncbi:MAG: 50S ribosomal protein L3 [Candidatus Aminicenantes bacterium]|nr:50S ribosomal protein L3 [Candidatus Aminicenantes bacterium]